MTCAVFFNLDGTLTENTTDYEAIYAQAVQEADLDELKNMYKQYTDSFFTYFQRGWAFPRRQAILDLLNEHNIDDVGVSDRFAAAWEDAEAEQTQFRPTAKAVFQQLEPDHVLGIITNGTGQLQRRKLENASLTDLLTSILVSSEIGVSKPNVAFFETARETVNANTCIAVSHDLRRDILPAKRAEFKTIWIAPPNDAADNPQMKELIDAHVTTLEDVPDAVRQLCE